MNDTKDDYYNTLGVSNDANTDEIKKAYRKLSLKYHPDKTNNDVESTRKFQCIGEAYETLGDETKKKYMT